MIAKYFVSRAARHVIGAVLAALVVTTVTTAFTPVAYAQETDAQREANTHFQRAVGLYAEADYRAALVEFKRAYEIAPHVTVLYNLGQTYYQLQNYAQALTTFERFLAEGGTAHRSEVEAAVNVLKARVGKLDITTTTPGWDVSIDDEVVGKTPLDKPISVSIGRRKISATKTGEAPLTRNIEVAAGETAKVELVAAPVAGGGIGTPVGPGPEPTKDEGSNTLLIVGWVGTAALATGAIVTGILASSKASQLKDARDAFPGNKSDIDAKASSTTTLAIVTDVLGASAIVLGGVSLYFTLTKSSSSKSGIKPTTPTPGTVRVGVEGSRVVLGGSF